MFNYVIRRLLQMIPLLAGISVISFVIIELPPGDYLSTVIEELRRTGAEAD